MDVIGFGALNWDRLLKVPRIASGDEELIVQEETFAPGGSAANTIFALAKIGFRTGYVGAIGDDSAGRKTLIEFDRIGVDTSRVGMSLDHPTGAAYSLIDSEGERALYISPGANDTVSEDDLDLEFIHSSRILHMSSFCGEEQFRLQKGLLESMPPEQILSFAPGAIYAARGDELNPFIERANALILNRREIEKIAGVEYTEGARKLIDKGCGLVAITLGKEGCFVASKDGDWVVAAFPAEVVDTTGAGDAFAAGFLSGMLENRSPESCGMLGNVLAAMCIAKMGARAGLPTRALLDEFLRTP
jgi:ribokinase